MEGAYFTAAGVSPAPVAAGHEFTGFAEIYAARPCSNSNYQESMPIMQKA
jgi:hypothetical protein